ncbi:MAG: hypothetical protein MAG453_01195 [Calditrichaeota bacterium]|nr:hypothetical protein [Calditrichota bacterium]
MTRGSHKQTHVKRYKKAPWRTAATDRMMRNSAQKRTSRTSALSGLILAAAGLFVMLALAGCGGNGGGGPSGESGLIGIYSGAGAWPDFAGAVDAALDTLGRDTEFFTEADAQSGLSSYALIVFPGGDPLAMVGALGFTGRENVRLAVGNGAGYIGLGGGAYLAADTLVYDGSGSTNVKPFALFEGSAFGPITSIAPAGSYAQTLVDVLDTRFDPELTGSFQSLYRGGPEWLIEAGSYTSIARYTQTGNTAGVTFEHGLGRVALLSFHPEIEEGDDRDETTFGDDLDDPDSEWFLLRAVAEWCLREAY